MAIAVEKMTEDKRGPYTAEDYWNLPEGRRAELINGWLYDMAAPSRVHQRIVLGLARAFADYIDAHGGPCEVNVAPFAVNLFGDDSEFVEPDVTVVCDPAKLSDRGCEGAPDLVIEVVSPSCRTHDYLKKANLYEQAGVREYWIVDPETTQTAVYRYGSADPAALRLAIYPFDQPVPATIWDNFSVTLTDLL